MPRMSPNSRPTRNTCRVDSSGLTLEPPEPSEEAHTYVEETVMSILDFGQSHYGRPEHPSYDPDRESRVTPPFLHVLHSCSFLVLHTSPWGDLQTGRVVARVG